MSKRLQVILDDRDYREIKRAAQSRQMPVSEWVRQALRQEHRREPLGSTGKKLEVIRSAALGDYPTAEIDRMLAEIEKGYGAGVHR